MFQNLIRRISHSIIPRPDRPWADDATSNAPQKRKRRLSTSDQDSDEEGSKKKIRSGVSTPLDESKPVFPQPETQEVKEVTAGVKEVELQDKPVDSVAPEAVPLPEGESNELDEPVPSSDNSEAPKPQDQADVTPTAVDVTPAAEAAPANSASSVEDAPHQDTVIDSTQEPEPSSALPTSTTEVKEVEEDSAPATTNDDAKPVVEEVQPKSDDVNPPQKD